MIGVIESLRRGAEADARTHRRLDQLEVSVVELRGLIDGLIDAAA